MILSDKTIKEKLKNKELIIKPQPHEIQPSSVDLRLGTEFWSPVKSEEILDIKNNEPKYNIINANAIVVPPNEFILATTEEWVEIPASLSAKVEGRSSIGRLGVAIHVTAGFIDPGFKGNITLEIKNLAHQPIMLHSGMRICQLCFEYLDKVPDRQYGECNNKYQDQKGVVGSLAYWDYDNQPVGS